MERAVGEAEGVSQALIGGVEAMLAKFHRFEILDEVMLEFVLTNARGFAMPELLALPKNATEFTKFSHCNVPYLATVRMLSFDKLRLEIKLPDNGFIYKAKEGASMSRHKSDTWVRLRNVYKHFPKLVEMTPDHQSAAFFYNFGAQRVDILMRSSDSATPDIMISYEPGFPYKDDDDEYQEAVR